MLKKIIALLIVFSFTLTGISFAEKKGGLVDKGGTKYEIAGNKLYIVFAKNKTAVKDGTYNFTDGTRIVVEDGKIIKKTKVKAKGK